MSNCCVYTLKELLASPVGFPFFNKGLEISKEVYDFMADDDDGDDPVLPLPEVDGCDKDITDGYMLNRPEGAVCREDGLFIGYVPYPMFIKAGERFFYCGSAVM